MSEPFLIGLVGARGFTGRELIRLIAGHPSLMLAYASSREMAGRKVSEMAPEHQAECVFEAMGPDDVARRRADAVVLALPDGAGAAYVEAIDAQAPHRVIVDLSADRRFDPEWVYGLPELLRLKGEGSELDGAKRIANPGCYATAMQLAIAPLLPLLSDSDHAAPSVFGASGYSGAGTKPSPKNDEARLADNLMAYKLVGHNHEREATRHLGRTISFTPHVHPAFRGLLVTAHIPLATPINSQALHRLYEDAYGGEPLVSLQDAPPELKDGAEQLGVLIGGFEIAEDGRRVVMTAAEDNLLKGAAVQAVQNLNRALELPEMMGLPIDRV